MMYSSISQANSLIGRSIGDSHRYRIESHLGKGGMGEVYQANDTRLGKVVAIKLLKAFWTHASTKAELDFKRRFERECAICAALNSENIVQVSDYGITDEGYPFYVMEYLEGQTLEKALEQETKLPVERAINIMMQICAGLRSAHVGVTIKTSDRGPDSLIKVIHRDLKPANIFLVPTLLGERVKIIDFGVAKIQSSHLDNTDFTSAFLGTHHYAAPEQFNNQVSIDERVDIYCLGIIFYEMLAGVDPFGLKLPGQRITGESWINAHLLKPVQPLRSQAGCESLSVELEQIVMRCLEKDPTQRFSTVQELAQTLKSKQSLIGASLLSKVPEQNPILNDSVSSFQIPRPRKQVEERLNKSLDSSLSRPSASLSIYPELINKCQEELAIHIGPIAKLIVERTLDDIGYCQTGKFIEALASQIPDVNAAKHFRRTCLEEKIIPRKQVEECLNKSLDSFQSKPSASSLIDPKLIDKCQEELAIQQYEAVFGQVIHQQYPISDESRQRLNQLQRNSELNNTAVESIEAHVTRTYEQELQQYQQITKAIQRQHPLSNGDDRFLANLRRFFNLNPKRTKLIETLENLRRVLNLNQSVTDSIETRAIDTYTSNLSLPINTLHEGKSRQIIHQLMVKVVVVGVAFTSMSLLARAAYIQWWQVNQAPKGVLEVAETLKAEKNYEACANQAREIPPQSRFYREAQTLLNQCQHLAQDEQRLVQAKAFAAQNNFKAAIAQASKIKLDDRLRFEAQQLMSQWSKSLKQAKAKSKPSSSAPQITSSKQKTPSISKRQNTTKVVPRTRNKPVTTRNSQARSTSKSHARRFATRRIATRQSKTAHFTSQRSGSGGWSVDQE